MNFNYYPKNSWIHKWDPRIKLVILVFLMIVSLLKIKLSGVTALMILFLILFLLAKLPIYFLVKPWWKFLLLFIILIGVSSFMMPIRLPEINDVNARFNLLKWGYENQHFSIESFSLNEYDFLTKWDFNEQKAWIESVLRRERITSEILEKVNDLWLGLFYRWKSFTFSWQTIFRSLYIVLKLYLVMNWSLLLVRTTKLEMMLNALEDLLTPLKYLKININKLAIALTLIFNAIPLMMREAKINVKAQACKGSDLQGNWIQKIKVIKSLIIPIFNQTFIRADILGTTMYSRGYRINNKRSRYYTFKNRYWDWIFAIIIVMFTIFLLLLIFNPTIFIKVFPFLSYTFKMDKYI